MSKLLKCDYFEKVLTILINNIPPEDQRSLLCEDKSLIKFIHAPDESTQVRAFYKLSEEDVENLKYIEHPCRTASALAIKEFPYAIKYIKNPTLEEIVLAKEVIEKNKDFKSLEKVPFMLKYMDDEFLNSFFDKYEMDYQTILYIKYIDNPSENLKKKIISKIKPDQAEFLLENINNRTLDDINNVYLSLNLPIFPNLIKNISNEEIQYIAIIEFKMLEAKYWIEKFGNICFNKKNQEIIIKDIDCYIEIFQYIDLDESIQEKMAIMDENNILLIRNPSEKIIEYAMNKNPLLLNQKAIAENSNNISAYYAKKYAEETFNQVLKKYPFFARFFQ